MYHASPSLITTIINVIYLGTRTMSLIRIIFVFGFLAGAGFPMTAMASPQSSTPKHRTGVFTCLTNNNITNISPSRDPNWQDFAPNYNLRLQYVPDVVVVPANNGAADEISKALGCATQNGLSVQAMSGSHSYASYSLGGKNGSMVISLLNLQDVELDATTNIAKFGAGIRLGNLALALGRDLRALSHGTGADVGSGGHFTHGGYGYTSRAWGLAMDQIVALDVVTADGSLVHATEESAPDLYYVSPRSFSLPHQTTASAAAHPRGNPRPCAARRTLSAS